MARPGKRRLTPKGVLALKREGYYADAEAVGFTFRWLPAEGRQARQEARHQPIVDLPLHKPDHQEGALDGLG